MASGPTDRRRADLLQRVTRFVGNRSTGKRQVIQVLRQIRSQGWRAFLFGGALRDLMIGGPSVCPRDIDIVVDGVSVERIASVFAEYVERRTRFGGLHLNVDGWMFDVWPLAQTWAFREGLVPCTGFAALPKTTFLNVEAAVIQLAARPGQRRVMHEHGFFDGVLDRTLEINLEENPFPVLCVVRSLITAARLDFKLSSRLASYILHHTAHAPVEELLAVQASHYGRIESDAEELHGWLTSIGEQQRHSARHAVRLPVVQERQLEFWEDQHAAR